MDNTTDLPANEMAERIVRHFQSEGFSGISEALILRIGLKKGDQSEVVTAFNRAADQQKMPPVGEYFELRPSGHFSDFRSFEEAKAAIQSDFAAGLRKAIPDVFFEPAPVVIEDALATGSKYDALLKLRDNADGYAFVILLNDPDSSFFEYLGTHRGNDWQKIIGDFGTTAVSFGADIDLR